MSSKRISFLGPEGTFTDQASVIYSPPDATRVAFPELHLVLASLTDGDVDEAVVPIENSLMGSVIDIVDFLVRSDDVYVRGEMMLNIELCLIAQQGTAISDIVSIESKQEALSQCREFLDTRLPNASRTPVASTVEAVSRISRRADSNAAAIGPMRAAEIFDLPILEAGIQDRKNNVTRFVILGHEDHEPTAADKTSVAFNFVNRDAPGQLHAALGLFAEKSINLTHVESRPTGDELGSYVFLLDFNGHRHDPDVAEVIEDLKSITSFFKILGSFPVATEIH